MHTFIAFSIKLLDYGDKRVCVRWILSFFVCVLFMFITLLLLLLQGFLSAFINLLYSRLTFFLTHSTLSYSLVSHHFFYFLIQRVVWCVCVSQDFSFSFNLTVAHDGNACKRVARIKRVNFSILDKRSFAGVCAASE